MFVVHTRCFNNRIITIREYSYAKVLFRNFDLFFHKELWNSVVHQLLSNPVYSILFFTSFYFSLTCFHVFYFFCNFSWTNELCNINSILFFRTPIWIIWPAPVSFCFISTSWVFFLLSYYHSKEIFARKLPFVQFASNTKHFIGSVLFELKRCLGF